MVRKVFKPHDYQNKIIDFAIENPRSSVWAGMGMGKTSSILTVIDTLFLMGKISKPVLALAPLRVARSTWPNETQKWEHLKDLTAVSITGTAQERKDALRLLNSSYANVFTMNYDNIPWLIEQLDGEWPFDMVTPDESTRLKNFRLRGGGKRTAELRKVAFKSKYWTNLTGTPAPNGLTDLWGQQWFIDQGERLGRSYRAFEERFFRQVCRRPEDRFYDLKPLEGAEQDIYTRLADVCITLRPEDYFDVDAPIIRKVEVDLPAKVRKQYTELQKQYLTEISGTNIEALSAAAKSAKCLQMASGAVYNSDQENRAWVNVHDEKLDALESIIQESGGEPILVAYHWKHDLEKLLKAFPQGRPLDDNPKTEDEWNTGKIPLMFVHPQSAGHGLNLQDGGRIIVFFSEWWDLETYQQVIERIGPVRQMQSGHPRSVFEYHIIARRTLDEEVFLRRTEKREVQDLLLEAMKRD
jgi:SNF2 family DNA or RNA helicase